MFPSNPSSEGAVEFIIQRANPQCTQMYGTPTFHRNSRKSTGLDSTLTYDQFLQFLKKAIAEGNRSL
ncbi:hypothetical protein BX591_107104 [Paraburkholderia bryophila]|uniref:Uncharacterized protein n=1 Tax=Paraburkholderia bryophila TaxID=420952 RepID=A0A329CGS7_9BURK|nr:hypothetical protein BX591_107104 [Paraburkholderia bryophila]